MRGSQLFPSNKWYLLALCGALAASVVFLRSSADTRIAEGNTTLRGRPIIEKDGKTLLWSSGDPQLEDAKWWDVTDALIDPELFDHGLGADAIPSIDAPVFMTKDDPRFEKRGLPDNALVIGVEIDGEARAYPINVMRRHELVNDTFGETHLTVAY